MAFYSYTCEKCGETQGLAFGMKEEHPANTVCLACGGNAKRDIAADRGGSCHSTGKGWPMLSDAMAVHPDQIQETREHAARHGVPTDFVPDGRPILLSRNHRKRYGELIGQYDRNGGYGDPQKRR